MVFNYIFKQGDCYGGSPNHPGCHSYVPTASLFCDTDGYVTLKEKPAGKCTYNGYEVRAGSFDPYNDHGAERDAYWAREQETGSMVLFRSDVPARGVLTAVYSKSSVPEKIKNSLQECKFGGFRTRPDFGFPTSRNAFIKVNGKVSNFTLDQGTGNPKDTCATFYNGLTIIASPQAYLPIDSLSCDSEGYVGIKEIPSGKCIFNGLEVNIGEFKTESRDGRIFNEYSTNYTDVTGKFLEKSPDMIKKAIGSCKFKSSSYGKYLKIDGFVSGYQLQNVDDRQYHDDTCFAAYSGDYRFPHYYFLPSSSLYCDSEGYASLKEGFSGNCTFHGTSVKVGEFKRDSPEWKLFRP